MASFRPVADRFHEKYVQVPLAGCWIWTATTDGLYGLLSVGRKMEKAHRFSWELHVGPIPSGMCVMHRCDNPACVNPHHLMLGTQLENIADRDRKGRQRPNYPRGDKNGMALLDWGKVAEIRASSEKPKALAAKYGVSVAAIRNIIAGRSWQIH